jgi:hypothetical protein
MMKITYLPDDYYIAAQYLSSHMLDRPFKLSFILYDGKSAGHEKPPGHAGSRRFLEYASSNQT